MTTPITIGDRVLFTNPSTGQQLVGTVESYHADKPRPWLVEFDSHMFRDTRDTTYLVSEADCVVL